MTTPFDKFMAATLKPHASELSEKDWNRIHNIRFEEVKNAPGTHSSTCWIAIDQREWEKRFSDSRAEFMKQFFGEAYAFQKEKATEAVVKKNATLDVDSWSLSLCAPYDAAAERLYKELVVTSLCSTLFKDHPGTPDKKSVICIWINSIFFSVTPGIYQLKSGLHSGFVTGYVDGTGERWGWDTHRRLKQVHAFQKLKHT